MNARIAVVVALIAASLFEAGAAVRQKQAPPPATPPAPVVVPVRLKIAASTEAQDAVKALRSIEARVESGTNFAGYSTAVSELSATLAALDELLESRGETDLRAQVKALQVPYQQAKELWGACFASSDACGEGVIFLDKVSLAAILGAAALKQYPSVEKTGTVLYYPDVLNLMWKDAMEKGKAFRADLRDK